MALRILTTILLISLSAFGETYQLANRAGLPLGRTADGERAALPFDTYTNTTTWLTGAGTATNLYDFSPLKAGAVIVGSPCLTLVAGSDYLQFTSAIPSGATATWEGTAGLSIIPTTTNRVICTTNGTVWNIKIYDGTNLWEQFPCNAGYGSNLYGVVNGRTSAIVTTNLNSIWSAKQNGFFWNRDNGFSAFCKLEATNSYVSLSQIVPRIRTNVTVEIIATAEDSDGIYLGGQISVFALYSGVSGSASYLSSGNPSMFVNDVQIGTDRGSLYVALGIGSFKKIKITNLDLSAWSRFTYGFQPASGYTTFPKTQSIKVDWTSDGTWDSIIIPSLSKDGFIDSIADDNLFVGNLVVIGDSTVCRFTGEAISYFARATGVLTDLSTAGDSIGQQTDRWNALSTSVKSNANLVVVQIGLNDLNPAETATVALSRYQSLVNTINSNTTAPIAIMTMTPCKQRLIDIYGSTNGLVSYQKWLDMNDAIMGINSNAVYGVDFRQSSHTADLNDGNGNLLSIYDSGDHIHETDFARVIIANRWKEIGYPLKSEPIYYGNIGAIPTLLGRIPSMANGDTNATGFKTTFHSGDFVSNGDESSLLIGASTNSYQQILTNGLKCVTTRIGQVIEYAK